MNTYPHPFKLPLREKDSQKHRRRRPDFEGSSEALPSQEPDLLLPQHSLSKLSKSNRYFTRNIRVKYYSEVFRGLIDFFPLFQDNCRTLTGVFQLQETFREIAAKAKFRADGRIDFRIPGKSSSSAAECQLLFSALPASGDLKARFVCSKRPASRRISHLC